MIIIGEYIKYIFLKHSTTYRGVKDRCQFKD